MYNISEDDGFLVLLDPNTYVTFIGDEADFDQIIHHIKDEMSKYRILVWGTETGGNWRVQVVHGESSINGYRDVTGFITVSQNFLCITNFFELRMTARNPLLFMPTKSASSHRVELENGTYSCRIIQLYDPNDFDDLRANDESRPNFIISFEKVLSPSTSWNKIPFSNEG